MLIPESYIAKDGDVFFFDMEEYNQNTDIPLEEGDSVKFKYEDKLYLAKVSHLGGIKNISYFLEILRQLG